MAPVTVPPASSTCCSFMNSAECEPCSRSSVVTDSESVTLRLSLNPTESAVPHAGFTPTAAGSDCHENRHEHSLPTHRTAVGQNVPTPGDDGTGRAHGVLRHSHLPSTTPSGKGRKDKSVTGTHHQSSRRCLHESHRRTCCSRRRPSRS